MIDTLITIDFIDLSVLVLLLGVVAFGTGVVIGRSIKD